MLKDKSELNTGDVTESKSVDYLKIYRATIITNVINPKVALFFIAFLPQFIHPTLNNTILPFFIPGITIIIMGMIGYLILANFASAIFVRLKHNKKFPATSAKFSA